MVAYGLLSRGSSYISQGRLDYAAMTNNSNIIHNGIFLLMVHVQWGSAGASVICSYSETQADVAITSSNVACYHAR